MEGQMMNAARRVIEQGRNPMRAILIALVAAAALFAVACSSGSADVASLEGADGTADTNTATDAADTILDGEAAMMAFVQCMREQGIEYEDPVVDSDGNVQKPELVEGLTVTKEEFGAAYEVCGEILEGLTFGKKRQDVSETVDELVALAECLRDKGFEVDEPTAETLDIWYAEFKQQFDWDDPAAMAAYEECSGSGKAVGGKK
jgi:hypothetical protein